MKRSGKFSMGPSTPENNLDLKALLELPSEDFLPHAFRELMGREPDVGGLLHYIGRLQNGLPRELILAEMRHSAEGQIRAFVAQSAELDALHTRYIKVRDLPLGKLRWKLLPRLSKTQQDDARFDWTRWINAFPNGKYVEKADNKKNRSDINLLSREAFNMQFKESDLDRRATTVIGGIDIYEAGFVFGWAMNVSQPDKDLNIAIIHNNSCIGKGVADQLREDFRTAGIRDGACGFKIKVTPLPTNGKTYTLHLIDADTGESVNCQPYEFSVEDTIRINIEDIEFGHLKGGVFGITESDEIIPLIITIDDGSWLQTATAIQSYHNIYRFNIALPPEFMDGMPHVITVTLPEHPGIETSYADVLPFLFTPWEYLVSSAKELNYSALSRTSAYRYESLKKGESPCSGCLFARPCANGLALAIR